MSDYLFDKQGPPDPEVEHLERLLAPLAREASGARPPARPAVRAGTPGGRLLGGAGRLLGGAGALAALLLAGWLLLRAPGGAGPAPGGTVDAPPAGGPVLRSAASGVPLGERSRLEAGERGEDLLLGELGRVRLEPGSRLEVRRLDFDETRLYLERGRLHALVYADARPRFFQVDTPATRCVDLGCAYTLTVDEHGAAHVLVETGQVAFENEGREVYVPAGASCRATRAAGAGLPRFTDAPPALQEALERFEAAAGADADERRGLAARLLAATPDARHALSAWHLLDDPDAEVARRARARLVELAGPPAGVEPDAPQPPGPVERQRWKEHLAPAW